MNPHPPFIFFSKPVPTKHVCYFYQAGCCKNGDKCTFVHPKVRCRTFSADGWCPYGYNCHFWHDPSIKPGIISMVKKPCQFFANNQCKYGDKCSFSHDIDVQNNNGITLEEYRATKKVTSLCNNIQAPKSTTETSNCKHVGGHSECDFLKISPSVIKSKRTETSLDKNFNSVRQPFKKYASVNTIDFQAASREEISVLNHSELECLKKHFPPDKLCEIESNEDHHMFFVRFSSTDPDWAYDVREIILNIYIPQMYPKEPLRISVVMQEYLPVILVDADVISRCKSNNMDNGSNLPSSYDNTVGLTPPAVIDGEILGGFKSLNLNSCSDSNPSVAEGDKTSLENKMPIMNKASNNIPSHSDASSNVSNIYHLTKENDFQTNSSLDYDSMIGLIPPVIPRSKPKESHGDDYNSCDEDQSSVKSDTSVHSQTSESVLESDSTDDDVNDSSSKCEDSKTSYDGELQGPCEDLHDSPLTTRGTQKLLMSGLRLLGKAGTYIQRRLSVSLHCTRCRLNFQWLFTFHGAQSMNDFNDPNTAHRLLRSLPPHTANCARCHQKFSLLFQSSLAHAFDNNIGTLHLDGCIADDVPSKQSDGIILCTECFHSVRVTGLDFGCPLTRRCFNCHSLTGLEFNKFQLELLKQPSSEISKNSCSTNQDLSSQISRRMRRTMNSAQNALIQDGSPLPAYGSCKHYRKSYRWLRFPCCGRLEPCDVCHDNSAVDGHEMELATRMVCGFCSKEQPFSTSKPCIRCGKMLSGTRSSHWEGGKGCRNQVTMSRKDSRKYSQVNKVISKKKTKRNK
ncbi:unnamed protein product [Schistosoma turkestanicum]|nr:unnamed protein product [Schistosoma turkestanicum]